MKELTRSPKSRLTNKKHRYTCINNAMLNCFIDIKYINSLHVDSKQNKTKQNFKKNIH